MEQGQGRQWGHISILELYLANLFPIFISSKFIFSWLFLKELMSLKISFIITHRPFYGLTT